MTRRRIIACFALTGTILVGLFNYRLRAPAVREYRPGDTGPDVAAQLDGLRGALDDGAAESMQELFPEGYVFTWALYGLARVQVGMNAPPGSDRRHRAVAEARRAVDALDSPRGRAPFNGAEQPKWGIFYTGWLARLRGGLLAIADDPATSDVEAFRRLCDRIAGALEEARSPYLTSYPGKSWPVDTVVAVSALRLHDHLFEPRYEDVVDDWVGAMRSRLDPETGLIPHRTAPGTGETIQGARGSSQALLLRFLIDVDPELARQHYGRFRSRFAAVRFGLIPGVREYPTGRSGPSDVDSGPIVLGFSAPATVVGMGTALSYGDRELAEPLLRGIEATGLSYRWGGEKRYALGYLPVGEAFLVWSKTARPLVAQRPGDASFESIVADRWLWRWHLLSAVIVALCWCPSALLYRRRRE